MKQGSAFLAFASFVLSSGCAHVLTTTSLHTDGSYERNEIFSIPGPPSAAEFNRIFHFRAEKDGIMYSRESSPDEQKLTVTRQGVLGQKDPIDLEVVGSDRKPVMSSQVSVTKTPAGDISYSERLHWLGPVNSFDLEQYFAEQSLIRNKLPAAYRSEKTVVAITGALREFMNSLLLGPPKPNLIKAFVDKQVSRLELTSELATYLQAHEQQWLPGISSDDLNLVASSLTDIYLNKALASAKNLAGGAAKSDGSGSYYPLTYTVTPPGKVVETNGLIAKDGRVYWEVVPLATQKHDVILTLVCKPGAS